MVHIKSMYRIGFQYGSWTPFIPSSDFSDYIGPIEVRKNWKINGIDINFDQ